MFSNGGYTNLEYFARWDALHQVFGGRIGRFFTGRNLCGCYEAWRLEFPRSSEPNMDFAQSSTIYMDWYPKCRLWLDRNHMPRWLHDFFEFVRHSDICLNWNYTELKILTFYIILIRTGFTGPSSWTLPANLYQTNLRVLYGLVTFLKNSKRVRKPN